MKRAITLFLCSIALLFCCGCSFDLSSILDIFNKGEVSEAFLASDTPMVHLYQHDNEKGFVDAGEKARGTQIEVSTKRDKNKDSTHSPITIEDETYYVDPQNIVDDYNDCVKETDLYVRTPVTLLQNPDAPEIAGFAKKGTHLSITGFEGLNDTGEVELYSVATVIPEGEEGEPQEGWVYSKYLVSSQESANQYYDGDGNGGERASGSGDIPYDLHGGAGGSLDYYPRERPDLGHPFLEDARGLYLNASCAENIDPYIELINDSGINCVVIDIKDGYMGYESQVCQELSPTSYDTANLSFDEYKAAIDKLDATGVYMVGRIVCFNDSYYGMDNPDTCITSSAFDGIWPSAYSREAWYYNVRLAIEAVETLGFDEIQFDYVRFPESSFEISEASDTNFRNVYDETKSEAIQNFCLYASDQIHRVGAYFSVDVFGETGWGYVTAYGQYWPAISNVVDAISAMPYTDHYGDEIDTWSDPYSTMLDWAEKTAHWQSVTPSPAAARTWLTGYDTPFWSPYVDYDTYKMRDQAQACVDGGLTGGFIPWNAAADLGKYREYIGLWDAPASSAPADTESEDENQDQ